MNKDKIALYSHICIVAAAIAAIAYLGARFLIPAILPFVIAWGMALITRRPADFLEARTRISGKFYRPALAILLIIVVIGGGIFVIVKIVEQAWGLLSALGEDGTLATVIDAILDPIAAIFGEGGISPKLEESLGGALSGILSTLLSKSANVISSVAGAVPKIFLFILITAISSVYFAIDLENVNKYIHKLLPKKADAALIRFKETSLGIVIKYIRSYSLIMLLMFSLMFFGLSVIGVRYALLMAAIIAFLDLLPIIGIGTVLIPWGVFMLAVGNKKIGIGLLILYGIGIVVRQVAEPKIVGKNLGLHPLIMLIAIYAGYSLLGFFGIILFPVIAVLLKTAVAKNSSPEVKE